MNRIIDIKDGDKLLVSRTDRLGDLILALPFVESLKKRYPNCQVEVMSSLYASPILENNQRIDRIVRVQQDQLVTNRLYKKDLLNKIRDAGYKCAVVLYPERHISRLFYKAGIPHRIGSAGRFHSVFFNHHLFHKRKENKKHESEYNLDFLRFFRDGETVTRPAVYPLDKEQKNARRILNEAGISDRFVVLHPGSGGSAESWPFEKFIELYSILTGRGLQVIMSGTDSEGERIEEIERKTGVRVNKITGQTDLRTLAALLSQAATVVANSTGPLHLAVAVGTRVVGLYPSKEAMSPVRWGPLGEGHCLIVPPVTVCQCPPRQCRCMEMIEAGAVADEVMAVFNGRK
ncbi:MAG: glycosyltransferase family 9 protein [Candidatus Zixiibacteriota bacterium]